jgi:hypothetical protein
MFAGWIPDRCGERLGFDLATGSLAETDPFLRDCYQATATPLADGSLLIVGG